jgi:hypothetical protein
MSLRTLKNGIGVTIREAESKDAEKMIAFYNRVGGESDFLSFGKGEFLRPVSELVLHPSPLPKTRVISMWVPLVSW